MPRRATRTTALSAAEFRRLVRDALVHLYDLPYLQTHALTRLVDHRTHGRPPPGRPCRDFSSRPSARSPPTSAKAVSIPCSRCATSTAWTWRRSAISLASARPNTARSRARLGSGDVVVVGPAARSARRGSLSLFPDRTRARVRPIFPHRPATTYLPRPPASSDARGTSRT